jgi:hypothetical protein
VLATLKALDTTELARNVAESAAVAATLLADEAIDWPIDR